MPVPTTVESSMMSEQERARREALAARSRSRRRRIVGNRARSFAEAEAWDLEFWQRSSPRERLAALAAIQHDVALARAARAASEREEL
jgi:hypothetical protein